MTFQIRKGKKILGEYSSQEEAGRELSKKLYYENNLALVEVRKELKKIK